MIPITCIRYGEEAQQSDQLEFENLVLKKYFNSREFFVFIDFIIDLC